MMSSGASTPPEVPEPSAIAQMTALTHDQRDEGRRAVVPPGEQVVDDVVADAQRARLEEPPTPTTRPPIAGHHIQWIGRRWNGSSAA